MKVVIDGNIGAGKTTQLTFLEKLGVKVFKEPIEEWPLDEFYANPKKGIFPLQMAVLRTLQPSGPGVYERSLLSSRWVFWEWAKRKKLVEHEKTYEYFYDKHSWFPDLYIYLAKSPDECYLHMSSRKQTGDSKVSLNYLRELDGLYKELLMNVPCKVYVVDASRNPEEIHSEILNIINNNEHSKMLFRDSPREEVQELVESRGKMRHAPCPNMCRVS
jgi:deoxyadenosine/deoxycytidine kinase